MLICLSPNYWNFTDQAKKANKSGIEQPSVLPESVKYGANLYLGSFCYIGENVVLGENVKIYPNSFVGDSAVIGNNVTYFCRRKSVFGNRDWQQLHDSFRSGYRCRRFWLCAKCRRNIFQDSQIGNVVIEDDVEIEGQHYN